MYVTDFSFGSSNVKLIFNREEKTFLVECVLINFIFPTEYPTALSTVTTSITDTLMSEANEIFKQNNVPLKVSGTNFKRTKRSADTSHPVKNIPHMFDDYIRKPWANFFGSISEQFPGKALKELMLPCSYIDSLPTQQVNELYSFFKKLGKDMPEYYQLVRKNNAELDYHLRNYIGATVPGMQWISPSRSRK